MFITRLHITIISFCNEHFVKLKNIQIMKKNMILCMTAFFALSSIVVGYAKTTVVNPLQPSRLPYAGAVRLSAMSGHELPRPKEKKQLPVRGNMILVESLELKDQLPVYLKKKKR